MLSEQKGHKDIIVLIMAAGSSQRFGSDKRFATLPNGLAMLQQSVKTIRQLGLPYKVIVSSLEQGTPQQRQQQRANLTGIQLLDHELFYSSRAEQGLGSSLSEAIANLAVGYKACLIVLADMPYVSLQTFRQLVRCWHTCNEPAVNGLAIDGAPINIENKVKAVVAVTDLCSKLGPPLIISSDVYPAFQNLQGEFGGKILLEGLKDACLRCVVEDQAIHKDIDYPSDL